MNDVEQDLRELLNRKAGSVGTVTPRLPDGVRARGRRRQSGTVLVGGLTALALVLGSVGLLRAVDTDRGRQPTPADDRWAGYEVFERTATVHSFTITAPSSWYLVDQWSWARPIAKEMREDSGVIPVLMLSNTDHGLATSPCFDDGFSVGRQEAVMTVALDSGYFAEHQGQADALPQTPTPFGTGEYEEEGPCGAGTYVPFATEDLPFVAHFSFGRDVTDEARGTLIASFETMTSPWAVIDGTPIGTRLDHPSGAYVIAGGENAAGPWTLELRPQTDPGYVTNVQLELITVEGVRVDVGGPFTVNEDQPIEQAGGDPVFGAVVKEADGVELHLEEGTPTIPAQLVPLPPSMPFGFDLFFASNDTDVQATAVAIGPNGEELTTGEASLPSITATPEPPPNERRRVAEGATGGTEWALEYEEGRELALVGSSDDILFDRIAFNHMASLSAENTMLIGVHDFGTTEQAQFLLYGVSHPDVDRIVITLVDGQVIELGRGTMRDPSIHIFGRNPGVSPGVWWVQMPPGPVVANVTAFDAACQRLGRAGLALYPGDEAEEITTKAECPALAG
jgi:hypothetical protein